MRCPYCGNADNRVIDSRLSRESQGIRRRRECLECGRRFTTRERVEEVPFDSTRKRMTTLHRGAENQLLVSTKGAIEAVLEVSTHIAGVDGDRALSEADRRDPLRTKERRRPHRRE